MIHFLFHLKVTVLRYSHNITSSSISLLFLNFFLFFISTGQLADIWKGFCQYTACYLSAHLCLFMLTLWSLLCVTKMSSLTPHFTSPLLLPLALLAIWQRCGKASAPLQKPSQGRSSWGHGPGMTWEKQWRHECWEPQPWWRPAGPILECGGDIRQLTKYLTILTIRLLNCTYIVLVVLDITYQSIHLVYLWRLYWVTWFLSFKVHLVLVL